MNGSLYIQMPSGAHAFQSLADACRLTLIQRVQSVPNDEDIDPYAHVASILTNVTREEGARKALVADRSFLQLVASQLRSQNLVRRRGFATALRNLFLKAEVRQVMLLHHPFYYSEARIVCSTKFREYCRRMVYWQILLRTMRT